MPANIVHVFCIPTSSRSNHKRETICGERGKNIQGLNRWEVYSRQPEVTCVECRKILGMKEIE